MRLSIAIFSAITIVLAVANRAEAQWIPIYMGESAANAMNPIPLSHTDMKRLAFENKWFKTHKLDLRGGSVRQLRKKVSAGDVPGNH